MYGLQAYNYVSTGAPAPCRSQMLPQYATTILWRPCKTSTATHAPLYACQTLKCFQHIREAVGPARERLAMAWRSHNVMAAMQDEDRDARSHDGARVAVAHAMPPHRKQLALRTVRRAQAIGPLPSSAGPGMSKAPNERQDSCPQKQNGTFKSTSSRLKVRRSVHNRLSPISRCKVTKRLSLSVTVK